VIGRTRTCTPIIHAHALPRQVEIVSIVVIIQLIIIHIRIIHRYRRHHLFSYKNDHVYYEWNCKILFCTCGPAKKAWGGGRQKESKLYNNAILVNKLTSKQRNK
jgi:hypothetical protein